MTSLRGLPTFRGDSAFHTWLYRVSYNAATTFLHSKLARERRITLITFQALENLQDARDYSDAPPPRLSSVSKCSMLNELTALECNVSLSLTVEQHTPYRAARAFNISRRRVHSIKRWGDERMQTLAAEHLA
jgi:DNA-directed RNA polymerase specialized sigma24 family protein